MIEAVETTHKPTTMRAHTQHTHQIMDWSIKLTKVEWMMARHVNPTNKKDTRTRTHAHNYEHTKFVYINKIYLCT